MDNKVLMGIIGVIGALLGFGGTQVLSGDVIDNTYVCNSNGNVGAFDSLSSTGVTGYYQNEYDVKKGKQCRNGGWTPIKDYATSTGVDIETVMTAEQGVTTCEPEIRYVQSEDCPVKVIAYTENGKYYCEGIGPGQKCKSTDSILSELG